MISSSPSSETSTQDLTELLCRFPPQPVMPLNHLHLVLHHPPPVHSQYSPLTGLIYIFNLIVGTGALTLPAAFHDVGWLLSSVIVIMLAFMSYLTGTFVIESMAAANAMVHWKRLQRLKRSGGSVSEELVTKTLQVQAMGVPRDTPGSPVLRPGTSSGGRGRGVPTGGAHKMRTTP
jgi:hypothetical protein